MNFHLPGSGIFAVTEFHVHPDFTGFARPALNDDLALLRLGSPITGSLSYPSMGSILGNGEEVSLVGFGRSGFGDLGYQTASSLANRRFGANVIDQLTPDDEGGGDLEVFRYDFDDDATVGQVNGSLGNDVESMIGPGDSGGPALRQTGAGWELVGINTFTQGRGGRFGDTGGGVVLAPYKDWITTTTGIPEPGVGMLMVIAAVVAVIRRPRS